MHAFSCDSDAKARAFIEATCPPAGPLFHDMLTRDVTCIPPHSVYVCGFPCNAFSMLRRHSTKLLQEASAKPVFATVAVLKQCRPRVAVFENVLGIRAVLPKVLRKLWQVAGYFSRRPHRFCRSGGASLQATHLLRARASRLDDLI